MSDQQIKAFLVSYWNGGYEDINDEIVFAYDEPHAIKTLLETNLEAKVVFHSTEVPDGYQVEAAQILQKGKS